MKHFIAAISAFAALGVAPVGHAAYKDLTVSAGWELFKTSSASFGGFTLYGNPLVTFDFGGSIGVKNTYDTDTIVQENGGVLNATDNYKFTTAVKVVALNLFTGKNGTGIPVILSPSTSVGTLTVTEDTSGTGGTYSTSFTIDATATDPSGNVYVINPTLISNGSWNTTLPSNNIIPRVNDIGFYPIIPTGGSQHYDPEHPGDLHDVIPVTTPLPAAIFFVAPALAGVFGWSRRKNNAIMA